MATGRSYAWLILLTVITMATGQDVLPKNIIGNEMAASKEITRILASQNDEALREAVHQSALQYLYPEANTGIKVDGGPNKVSATEPSNSTETPSVLPLIPTTYNVSQTCVNDTMQMLSDLVNRTAYALQMFDSVGKIPAGILEGNVQWIGASGECKRVTNVPLRGHTINGKYCQAAVPISLGILVALQIGVCVPDTCNNLDVLTMINTGVKLIPVPNLQVVSVHCTEEKPWSAGAIVMIVITCILACLMVAGTTYDIIIKHINRKVEKDPGYSQKTVQNGFNDETAPLLHHTMVVQREHYQPSVLGECLLAFSVLTNGGKILDARHSSGSLAAIHGIRVLSMWWVILGHGFITPLGFADNGLYYTQDFLPRFLSQAISNATFSVDTFFFLSGLLVTYLTVKELTEGRKVNWFLFYFHRFWRLTPVYMFLIFFVTYLLPYLGTGPYADIVNQAPNTCPDYWWTNLLYINNLVPWPGALENMCYGVSWYLANDMQFHVISPIIIILLYKKPRIGYAVIALLIGVCLSSRIGIALNHDLTSTIFPVGNKTSAVSSSYYYTKPWTRISTYLVGMVVGYLLVKTNCKLRINKVVNILCWAAAWAIALSVVYGLYGTYHGHLLSTAVDVLYMAVSRLAWSIAIGWLTFACLTGNGGPINAILAWTAWIPISRLTYCAYLTHIYVLQLYVMYQDRLINGSDINEIYIYISSLVISYMVSFVVSLMAEAPMMRLEKILLRKFKRSE